MTTTPVGQPTTAPRRTTGAVVVRNVGLSFATRIWFMVLGVAIVPYTVDKLGTDLYGVYLLVSIVLGYFSFLDLGLGAAATKYVAEYDSAGDQDAVTSVVRTALTLYFVLGLIGAAILAVATPWLITHVFSVPKSDEAAAKFAFYCTAVGVLVNFPTQVFALIPTA